MKMNRLLIAVLSCLAAYGVRADLTNTTPIALATVRDGANTTVDIDEISLGYAMVKYGSGSSAKAYFKFDLTGMSPNTNAAATFTISRFPNGNAAQHLLLWGLNQDYPAFTNTPGTLAGSLTWISAQANETNSNYLLTAPTNAFTATLVTDKVVPSSYSSFDFTLSGGPDGWGKFLFNNKLVLVLTATNDAVNGSGGARVLVTNATLLPLFTFGTTLGNLAPSISTISNQTALQGQTLGPIPFTVSDKEDPADWLSVWATTSKETVAPAGSLFCEGTGTNRTVTLTAGLPGTATITVHVSDSVAAENTTSFLLTVLPDPTLSAPLYTSTLLNTPTTPIPVTVQSGTKPASALVVTGTSANQNLVADAGIAVAGSGTNRTVTITPVTGQTGVAPLTLWVSDGINSNSTPLTVMILPSADVVFADPFDYPDGSLNLLSAGFWSIRTTGGTRVTVADQQALIRSSGSGYESLVAPLAANPYLPGSRSVLYTSLKATWTTLPPANSTGPFVHLYDNSGNLLSKIHVVTNNAPDGSFRLGIASGPGNNYTDFARDLTTNITYRLVSRYDPDTGLCAFWIDPASETSPSVLTNDAPLTSAVTSIGLRNQANMGTIQVDDLKVTLAVRPAILALRVLGGNVEIDFAAGQTDSVANFTVLRATAVEEPFGEVTATFSARGAGVFRASLPVTAAQGFFRIQRQPVSFP